jgi:hypothetical protein
MKKGWLKIVRFVHRISPQIKSIRAQISSMTHKEFSRQDLEERNRQLIAKVIQLLDNLQEFFFAASPVTMGVAQAEPSSEESDLSLAELLVLFRTSLLHLQDTSPTVQQTALNILDSYFVEVQGLYDLIFVSQDHSLRTESPGLAREDRYLAIPHDIADDPIIREYKSIRYNDLMNISVIHHLVVILKDLLPQVIWTTIKEIFHGKRNGARILVDPEVADTFDKFREVLLRHPFTERMKLSVALHRHTMRICDIVFTRMVLRWARPLFELLVLATWIQTVKDHIISGIYQIQYDEVREVTDKNGDSGKIRLSSVLFMQPRIKFDLERFLIFKIRTMTAGGIVRTTEFGNWVRKNSLDEFLQFFNIALGDMGGVGIRAMPEHEIIATQDTLWLYSALTSFVPCGLTSAGSIEMRKADYRLTKADQLLHEIRYYDPRFKGSSGLLADLKIIFKSLSVLSHGRVGKALADTESFNGRERELG